MSRTEANETAIQLLDSDVKGERKFRKQMLDEQGKQQRHTKQKKEIKLMRIGLGITIFFCLLGKGKVPAICLGLSGKSLQQILFGFTHGPLSPFSY